MAKARHGFTLIELLITIVIIGIMSSMVLFAMWQAQETAKEYRTRALITKLNSIVMRRFDEYRTRRVPIQFTAAEAADPKLMARMRMEVLRDLMRMEMPDRWSDVTDAPVSPLLRSSTDRMKRPAMNEGYLHTYNTIGTATDEHQGAECLYMIVMGSMAQEGDSRDFFKATDVADTDGDGFPEFVDAWKQPIQFLRWAPGYQSALQTPIRLGVTITSAGPNAATVTVSSNDGPRLSQTPGSYIGGGMAIIDGDTQIMDSRYMGKITGYKYTVTPSVSVTFTCETDSGATQQPFGGQTGSFTVLVMQPDPFDPRQVYPIYSPPTPDLSTPTYAVYPLVFSKGKDRASGIVDASGLRYADLATVALNPFYVPAPVTEPFGLLVGSVLHKNGTEPNWYAGCHLDNITNHDGPRR